MNQRDLLYSLACLSFAIMVGGAMYEHVAVVPRWSMAPPASLAMLQGPYGLNAAPFWMIIHPVTQVFLIASLVAFWKSARKKSLLIVLVAYTIILVVTFVHFVPELVSITSTPYSDTVDNELTARAGMWETLSIVRLIVIVGLSLVLFLGLAKDGKVEV